MKKKTILILLASIFIFSLFATVVAAADPPGALDSILGSIAGKNFAKTYDNYSTFIDMVIYLIIFIGLTQWTLGKKISFKKGGKALQIGIGIVFALGLAIWEAQAGFNIKSFGPVAFGILIAIMCFALYEGLSEFGVEKKIRAAIAYVAAYLTLAGAGVMAWLTTAGKERFASVGVLVGILAILFFLSLGLLVWHIGAKIFGMFTGNKAKKLGADDESEMDKQKGGKTNKEEAETELAEKFTEDEIIEIKNAGEEVDSDADTSIKKLFAKLKDTTNLEERKQIKESIIVECGRVIKIIKDAKKHDKKVRNLTRKLKRQIPADQLKEEEKKAMAYCDGLLKEMDQAIDSIEDIIKGIKKGEMDKVATSRMQAGTILKSKIPAQLGVLVEMEKRIDAELKG